MSRISAGSGFDFKKRVSYDPDAKRLFHSRARRQLKQLATALGLAPGAYDLRSQSGRHGRLGRSHAARRSLLRAGLPARDRPRQRCPVSDVRGSPRLCRRPQQLRLPRPSPPAGRTRTPHPRGVPCLTSLAAACGKSHHASTFAVIARKHVWHGSRAPGGTSWSGFRPTTHSASCSTAALRQDGIRSSCSRSRTRSSKRARPSPTTQTSRG